MPGPNKPVSRRSGTKAIRQSVSIPGPLAAEVRRAAEENLKAAYRRFLKEKEPLKKELGGRDMIRAIFGKDSIAEDPIL